MRLRWSGAERRSEAERWRGAERRSEAEVE